MHNIESGLRTLVMKFNKQFAGCSYVNKRAIGTRVIFCRYSQKGNKVRETSVKIYLTTFILVLLKSYFLQV
jgi:hypothetical protein